MADLDLLTYIAPKKSTKDKKRSISRKNKAMNFEDSIDSVKIKKNSQSRRGSYPTEPTRSPAPLSDRAKLLLKDDPVPNQFFGEHQRPSRKPSVKATKSLDQHSSSHNPQTPLTKMFSFRGSKKKKEHCFTDRLNYYQKICFDSTNMKYQDSVKNFYYLEDSWEEVMSDNMYMTQTMRLQQQAIWEFLTTERNYIRKLRVVVEVFQQCFRIIQSEGDLVDIKLDDIFANINQVLLANDLLWTDHLVKVINKTRTTRKQIKPSALLASFSNVEQLFEPYIAFCLKQDACLQNLRDLTEVSETKRSETHKNFSEYLKWCQNLPQAQRFILRDLLTEPMQRITRYPLLLKKIRKGTKDVKEIKLLDTLLKKIENFISNINRTLRKRFEREKLENCLQQFEYYSTMHAANEEVKWTAIDFLSMDIQSLPVSEQRCLLKRGAMKLIEKKARNETSVEAFLFTDLFLLARLKKSTNQLHVIRQLYYLNKIKLIKSDVSEGAIVFVYLDEFGLLQSTFLLDAGEIERDVWVGAIERARLRYKNAKIGHGSTLDFFKDANQTVTDTDLTVTNRNVGQRPAVFNGNNDDKAFQNFEQRKNNALNQNPNHRGLFTATEDSAERLASSQLPFEIIPENHTASWVLNNQKVSNNVHNDITTDQPCLGNSFRSHKSDSDIINGSDSGVSLRTCNSVPEIGNLKNLNGQINRQTDPKIAISQSNLSCSSDSSDFQTENLELNNNASSSSKTRHLLYGQTEKEAGRDCFTLQSHKRYFVSVETQTDDFTQVRDEGSTKVADTDKIDVQEQQQQTNISFSSSMFHSKSDIYDDVVIKPQNENEATANQYYAENYLDDSLIL